MRFVRFDIENFKGIKAATLDLVPAGANVFTLIGLNESGKTTILEALDEFGASREGVEVLYGSKRVAEFVTYVPKHSKANFTGKITIAALLQFEAEEISEIIQSVQSSTGYSIDPKSIPQRMRITRGFRFENSDYKESIYLWGVSLVAKSKKGKVAKAVELSSEPGKAFVAEVNSRIPKIVYFPTFLFSIPEKIVLNPDENKPERAENRLYRQIIQDVASSLSNPLDIKTHVVDRMLNEPTAAEQFFSFLMLAPDKQQQINATLNQISAHLTKTVFDSWGKIFSGNFKGREISVRLGVDNLENRKVVYLKFILKEGVTEFDVSERSLGFRWFFSFLLFTQYRVFAKGLRGSTLFLLDEPASNLHAKAQMQLLESFGRIAGESSGIMYSTHSHYMINPAWLDQSFVVANESINYENPGEEPIFSDGEVTHIVVDRYRSFVGQNPSKTTYFQPVLDKLDVVPSHLDLVRPTVLVEGKGDYFILEYGRRILLNSSSAVAVVPTRGATDMGELIGLFLGWGVEFAICLDADKAGKAARDLYLKEWRLSAEKVYTLEDVDNSLKGAVIEGLLAPSDIELIAASLKVEKPTKGQTQLFFSELLAKKEKLAFSEVFLSRIKAFEEKAVSALNS